ncbi:hypothetical protein FHX05_003843 [Rhizobium sp. BK491]|nr:hypothetical protein [Rhizobium sp. BK491]
MNREMLQAEATFAMPRPHAGPRPDVTSSRYRELRTAATSLPDANRVVYREELWAELTWRIDICLSSGSGDEIMVCASSGPRDQKFPRHTRARTRRLRLRRFPRSTIAAALQATSQKSEPVQRQADGAGNRKPRNNNRCKQNEFDPHISMRVLKFQNNAPCISGAYFFRGPAHPGWYSSKQTRPLEVSKYQAGIG